MANPTRGWDPVPVFGWWFDNPGVPAAGRIEQVMSHRIRRVDGRAIYPGGTKRVVTIGEPGDRDEAVAAMVKAAMKARDQLAHGAEFDEAAWEVRWNEHLPASIFTSFWPADDPDITPHGAGDAGYRVQVTERLNSGAGKPYLIQPLLAHLDLPIPGVNLADIDVPPGTPSVPAPIYAKGQPGGIAALSSEGRVLDAQGNPVGAVDPSDISEAVAAELLVNPPQVNATWDGLTGKPPVVAAGTTQSAARSAIGAAASSAAVPSGGTTGQVLAKTSATNHAVAWVDPPAGGGGPVDWDDLPAGSTQTVRWGGTAWPATRPTSRTDVTIIFRGGTTPPAPPTCLPGTDVWIRAASQ